MRLLPYDEATALVSLTTISTFERCPVRQIRILRDFTGWASARLGGGDENETERKHWL